MGEAPYCPRHERYIRNGGCVDCTREVEEAKEEGRAEVRAMLGSALGIIEMFRPLANAVRKNREACPPAVLAAWNEIAAMVVEAEARSPRPRRGPRGAAAHQEVWVDDPALLNRIAELTAPAGTSRIRGIRRNRARSVRATMARRNERT
jgi:hypothetical protein